MPGDAESVESSSDSQSDQVSEHDTDLEFYPAYCYKASPTWFTWVKLTAYDVHTRLHTRPNLQDAPAFANTGNKWIQSQTLLLFYLNHPIQFVQLVGVVVTFEDYFEKFWLFTLDDSSGVNIEINCRKPDKTTNNENESVKQDDEKDFEAQARCNAMHKLDIGAVVQVKGRISLFRDIRQIQLERLSFVHDTNHEIQLIAARTAFRDNVLARPWQISPSRQKSMREIALGESEHHNERLRRRQKVLQMKLDREKRHTQRIIRQYEMEERKRKEGADNACQAGRRLEHGF